MVRGKLGRVKVHGKVSLIHALHEWTYKDMTRYSHYIPSGGVGWIIGNKNPVASFDRKVKEEFPKDYSSENTCVLMIYSSLNKPSTPDRLSRHVRKNFPYFYRIGLWDNFNSQNFDLSEIFTDSLYHDIILANSPVRSLNPHNLIGGWESYLRDTFYESERCVKMENHCMHPWE